MPRQLVDNYRQNQPLNFLKIRVSAAELAYKSLCRDHC